MILQSWQEARKVAKSLKRWLSTHCPVCGNRHTKLCMDGGRCMYCGTTLNAVTTLAEAAKEAHILIEEDT